MKKVIEGRRYNTETADLIASYDNGLGRSDFDWCEVDLYRTKTGAWFLAGAGGARSGWGASCDGGRSMGPGIGIQVLARSEALEWCESHGIDADIIVENFEIAEA